ncbi:uncharacterized protein LAESUDRAFT_756174 [Laetiporus sulphureus 93-53]|uniref:Uncharacterized protein n=1 Tax=Laetiporus sulphureus 93-53 TaxID=1314785 RepID=A0A165G824_9APHY|nr:uncharacterized protein LAESUDRAFT_756174 [Laetiporus sulphureus 93-53]KZT09958.1 hypothetical protein LAESUDRAFT_756174 [Laetiporus sulphureus 93-53]
MEGAREVDLALNEEDGTGGERHGFIGGGGEMRRTSAKRPRVWNDGMMGSNGDGSGRHIEDPGPHTPDFPRIQHWHPPGCTCDLGDLILPSEHSAFSALQNSASGRVERPLYMRARRRRARGEPGRVITGAGLFRVADKAAAAPWLGNLVAG